MPDRAASQALPDADLSLLFGVLLSEFDTVGITVAYTRTAALAAGLDVSSVEDLSRKPPILGAMMQSFGRLNATRKSTGVKVLADKLIAKDRAQNVERLLSDHGFRYSNGAFLRASMAGGLVAIERPSQLLWADTTSNDENFEWDNP